MLGLFVTIRGQDRHLLLLFFGARGDTRIHSVQSYLNVGITHFSNSEVGPRMQAHQNEQE